MMLDDIVLLLKSRNMARSYVKATAEQWNRGELAAARGDYFFVILPQLLERPLPPKRYWLYFLEQNLGGRLSRHYNTATVGRLLAGSIKSMDYSHSNIKVWERFVPDLTIHYLPVPLPGGVTGPTRPKKYDVLFYGALNERRREILQELRTRRPGYRYCTDRQLVGEDLRSAIQCSRVALNIHHYDGDTVLEQPRLHELMRYSTFIVSEVPGSGQESMVDNYRSFVEFIPVIEKDLSNIDSMLSAIDRLLAEAAVPGCNYNLAYKRLFIQHYPTTGL